MKRLEKWFKHACVGMLRRGLRTRRPERRLPPLGPSPKILLFRPGQVGDLVVSTPILRALKRRYPNGSLHLLLGTANASAIQGDGNVDRAFVYRKSLLSAWRLWKTLRNERFDVIVDLIPGTSLTSAFIAASIRAKYRVALCKGTDFVYDVVAPQLPERHHIVDLLAQLLRPFGIDPERVELRPYCVVSKSAIASARRFLHPRVSPDALLVGLSISAKSPSRHWGAARFAALLREIVERHSKVRVLLLYAPSDEGLAQQIRTAVGPSDRVYAPRTECLEEFIAFLSVVDMAITPDTSTVHFASALGTPVLALFSERNRRWWPYGVLHRVVETESHRLSDIRVEPVVEAFEELYSAVTFSSRPRAGPCGSSGRREVYGRTSPGPAPGDVAYAALSPTD